MKIPKFIQTLLSLSTIAYWLLAIGSLSSCDPDRVFEKNKELPDYIWNANEKVSFDVNISDTLSLHNFYVNVRNADNYPFSNLYLFITTRFPDGKIARDTLECTLANDRGQWLGDGMGDIWDNQIPYKKNVRFPLRGTYTISLEQAMRVNQLPQIMDVGIRIEKQSH